MVCVWYLLRAQPSRPRRETAASAGGDRDACEARHEGAVTRATGRCQRSCLKRLSTTHMRCSKSPLSRANLALPGRRGRLGQYHQKSADLTINRRVNWVLAIPRSHRTAPQGRCVLRRDCTRRSMMVTRGQGATAIAARDRALPFDRSSDNGKCCMKNGKAIEAIAVLDTRVSMHSEIVSLQNRGPVHRVSNCYGNASTRAMPA